MNDLISREAAIEAVKTDWNYSNDQIRAINRIPPAQQWIPVTERLPEKCQTVIASVDTHIYEEARFVDGRWWWAYEARTDYWDEIEKDVTAWMPLPEPYKEENHEQVQG